jgi:outer membrane autotransporter protein
VTAGAGGFSLQGCICVLNTNVNNMPGGTLDGKIDIVGGNNTVTNAGLITITNAGTTIGPGAYVIQQNAGPANTYVQTSTGTLALRMNNTGVVDQLVADALNLTGTLRIVILQQLYPNVLTSANTAVQVTPGQPPSTTTFSSFVASSPFFTVTPIYTGTPNSFTAIDIQLGRIPFGSVPGSTRNQMAVGGVLEPGYSPSLDPNSVAGQFYANLLAATSIGVLDNLSGEGTAALQNASFGAGSQFNNATLGQLVFGDTSGTTSIIIPPPQYAATPKPRGADAFDSVLKAPPAPATQTGRWRLWTAGFGGYRTIDGNAMPIGSANQTIRNYGGAFGFDYQAAPDLLWGFAAGGSEANVSVPDRSTKGNLTGGHFGVYGLKTWGAAYLAASANYARFDNSTNRTIAGVGPTENATGHFASDQLSARLELGWKRAFANYTLTPFVAIEPAALWSHGYTETSTTIGGAPGVLGLSFAPRTTTSLPTFLGVQADTRIAFANGAVVSPYARASWVHEFEPSRQITATFVSLPTGAFTVDGARPARDSGRLDAGSKIQLDTTRSLFANLSGEWSGISQSYSATAGLKVTLQ